MCHFHKELGFVWRHETTKCVVINNFYFHEAIVMDDWRFSAGYRNIIFLVGRPGRA